MKKLKVVSLVLLVLIALVSMGCSSNSPKPSNVGSVEHMYYPEWWDAQDSPEFVYTYGEAVKSTSSTAKDAAYSNAMLSAANYVESNVKGMIKNFEEEAGVENPQLLSLTSKVVKVIANAKFNMVRVSKSEMVRQKDGKIKAFVRVQIPQGQVNKNTVSAIKNEEALYNEFKASQRFQELEKEIEKY